MSDQKLYSCINFHGEVSTMNRAEHTVFMIHIICNDVTFNLHSTYLLYIAWTESKTF